MEIIWGILFLTAITIRLDINEGTKTWVIQWGLLPLYHRHKKRKKALRHEMNNRRG